MTTHIMHAMTDGAVSVLWKGGTKAAAKTAARAAAFTAGAESTPGAKTLAAVMEGARLHVMQARIDEAFAAGHDDGYKGNVNRNPYPREYPARLWGFYEEGYSRGDAARLQMLRELAQ